MVTYRYIVTIETMAGSSVNPRDITNELDSHLDSVIQDLGIEHFEVEPVESRLIVKDSDYRVRSNVNK